MDLAISHLWRRITELLGVLAKEDGILCLWDCGYFSFMLQRARCDAAPQQLTFKVMWGTQRSYM